MNIPRTKHLELQPAGFLYSQSLGISFHFSAFCCCFVTLFPVRIEKSKHFGNSARQPEVGAVLGWFGAQVLCGGVWTWDLFAQMLQATGKKSNISCSKTVLCVCPSAEPARGWNWDEMWRRKRGEIEAFSCIFLSCSPAVFCLFQGEDTMDQSMERAWISAGGAGLGPLNHSWLGGGHRIFLSEAFPSSAVQSGGGPRQCLSLLWRKHWSINDGTTTNPRGFIAVCKDGSHKQNCSRPPARARNAPGWGRCGNFVCFGLWAWPLLFCVLLPAGLYLQNGKQPACSIASVISWCSLRVYRKTRTEWSSERFWLFRKGLLMVMALNPSAVTTHSAEGVFVKRYK